MDKYPKRLARTFNLQVLVALAIGDQNTEVHACPHAGHGLISLDQNPIVINSLGMRPAASQSQPDELRFSLKNALP